MTTMAEHITWSGSEAALKAYLGVTGDTEDARLQLWLESAVEAADLFLEQDFVDANGDDEDPPRACVLGVYEYVKALREYYPRASGITSFKTGAWSEAWQKREAGRAAYAAAVEHWVPHKKRIWTAGAVG